MIYACCTDERRNAVMRRADLNGIAFLEVLDAPKMAEADRQRTLFVHLLKPLAAGQLKEQNVVVEGGERIRGVAVQKVDVGTGAQDHVLTVEVDRAGDFSTYTLRLVRSASDAHPPDKFDPLLSAVDFSFKIQCATDFDCAPGVTCTPALVPAPDINYLARDYATFRQLMLDRLAALLPNWRETNVADLGVALVELLAYVGDHLSYTQDAIATEAYLGTARRRVSVRRHARLVDYHMHDGCNARVWAQVLVIADTTLPERTQLLTRVAGQPPRLTPSAAAAAGLAGGPDGVPAGVVVFETMGPAVSLFAAHQEMQFYTWGERECCLPAGATSATLQGHFPDLAKGQVLILEEAAGPLTGEPGDADPAHRYAVRLTAVAPDQDPLGGEFEDPPTADPVDVTLITWGPADALPFPLCITARATIGANAGQVGRVAVARGNVVVADHGLSTVDDPLAAGPVPEPTLTVRSIALATGADHCARPTPETIPPRFYPSLRHAPVTFSAPYSGDGPASGALSQDVQAAQPFVRLAGTVDGETQTWAPAPDLLNSHPVDPDFVVEVEADGTAFLRFGDGVVHGKRPKSGTVFTARYRVGNGPQGNVGAGALAHIVSSDAAVVGVRNPLPASGGTAPESNEDVRQRAPYAFRTQDRAVTAADYAEMAERRADVQRAAGSFRWTGSWRTMFVTVDRSGGTTVDGNFRKDMVAHLERYRMAGQDVDVDEPQPVSLEIGMEVCVRPDYFRARVKEALLQVFSRSTMPDGRPGLFHPDNFTFGQTVYLSPLYAAAEAVEGVESVRITRFARQGSKDLLPLREGRLPMGRLEVARLDNDPNFPERGVFQLTVEGGK